jgi:hypothetical protein
VHQELAVPKVLKELKELKILHQDQQVLKVPKVLQEVPQELQGHKVT